MAERFSGVKDCQKGGGAGNEAARALCCCCSSIMTSFSETSLNGRFGSCDQDLTRRSPLDRDQNVCSVVVLGEGSRSPHFLPCCFCRADG